MVGRSRCDAAVKSFKSERDLLELEQKLILYPPRVLQDLFLQFLEKSYIQFKTLTNTQKHRQRQNMKTVCSLNWFQSVSNTPSCDPGSV